MRKNIKLPPAKIKIENILIFKPGDLDDLCDATESAITEGGGFGWINVPSRKVLENYWKGVIAIPERELIIGRLDNVIAGSCQILKPSRNNEAQKGTCVLTTFFLAKWACIRWKCCGSLRKRFPSSLAAFILVPRTSGGLCSNLTGYRNCGRNTCK